MSTNHIGKGKRYISTSITAETYDELARRQTAAHWRSIGAYARAVLEHHTQQRAAILERRELYIIPTPTKAKAADNTAPGYTTHHQGTKP